MTATLRAVGVGLILVLLLPSRAWAYIDPVAGSTVFQAVIGALLAGWAYFWGGWNRLAQAIRRGARRLVGGRD